MANTQRSDCPVNRALELVGDRWTLLIVRDLMFTERRRFRELLQADEGISPTVLSDRLARLVEAGVLTRNEDPSHRQKAIYSLTPMGIDLFDVVVQLGLWGHRHLTETDAGPTPVARLEAGGPELWDEIRGELRRRHGAAGR